MELIVWIALAICVVLVARFIWIGFCWLVGGACALFGKGAFLGAILGAGIGYLLGGMGSAEIWLVICAVLGAIVNCVCWFCGRNIL